MSEIHGAKINRVIERRESGDVRIVMSHIVFEHNNERHTLLFKYAMGVIAHPYRDNSQRITRTTTCVIAKVLQYPLEHAEPELAGKRRLIEVASGVAHCVPSDQFSKDVGRVIALKRAIKSAGFNSKMRHIIFEAYYAADVQTTAAAAIEYLGAEIDPPIPPPDHEKKLAATLVRICDTNGVDIASLMLAHIANHSSTSRALQAMIREANTFSLKNA